MRWLMAQMWMWNWWRVVVCWCAVNGIAVNFIAMKTPFLYVMRLRALEDGDYPRAFELQKLIQHFERSGGMGAEAPHEGP